MTEAEYPKLNLILALDFPDVWEALKKSKTILIEVFNAFRDKRDGLVICKERRSDACDVLGEMIDELGCFIECLESEEIDERERREKEDADNVKTA